MRQTLSLCMIVRNEEDTLANCLSSVEGIFDEIVIVDTGSTDATLDIARKYTDKIFYFAWIDDFAAARNYAFAQSTCDYNMWLDADDVLLPDDAVKLRAVRDSLDGCVREVAAKYNVGFDENGKVNLEYYRERIFLRAANLVWSGRIHETMPMLSDCVYADFAVTHHKVHATEAGRNLKIFERMLSDGEVLDARNNFYYARELYYNGRIDDAIIEFEKYLARADGFVENRINACSVLADCLRLRGRDPLGVLLRSFEFDAPRAEICCEIGKYFGDLNRRKEAIYWYNEALNMTPCTKNGSFVLRDCYDFIPLLQLCVLYYAEGDVNRAMLCNQQAEAIKPNNRAVLYNKNFFNRNK